MKNVFIFAVRHQYNNTHFGFTKRFRLNKPGVAGILPFGGCLYGVAASTSGITFCSNSNATPYNAHRNSDAGRLAHPRRGTTHADFHQTRRSRAQLPGTHARHSTARRAGVRCIVFQGESLVHGIEESPGGNAKRVAANAWYSEHLRTLIPGFVAFSKQSLHTIS